MNELTYFEVGLRYSSVSESGLVKVKTDKFLVRCRTFSEAEEAAYKYGMDDMLVVSIRATKAEELVYDKSSEASIIYLVRYSVITLDEKTAKEKKERHSVYLQSSSVEDANQAFKAYMKGSILDYSIDSITETKIYGTL